MRQFQERGILVTVNTDDPKMFGTTLAEELRQLEETLGFSRAEIRSVLLQGIEASWLAAEAKRKLTLAFQSHPSWNEPAPDRALS